MTGTGLDLWPSRESFGLILDAPASLALAVLTVMIVVAATVVPRVGVALEARTDVLASGQWWRLVTYLFPHTAGTPHMLVNMSLLVLYGPQLERLVGGRGMLLTYVGGGAVAMVLLFALRPIPARTAGASLAVFAVFGALSAVYAVRHGVRRDAVSAFGLGVLMLALSGLGGVRGVGAAARPGFDGFVYQVVNHALGFLPGMLIGIALGLATSQRRWPTVSAAALVLGALAGGVAIGTRRWNQSRARRSGNP